MKEISQSYDNVKFLTFQQPIYRCRGGSSFYEYYIGKDIQNHTLINYKLLYKILQKINYDTNDNIDDNPNRSYRKKTNQTNLPEWEKWSLLSGNTDISTIKLLEKNLDKVDWEILSGNPEAIDILEENLDKVNSKSLSQNSHAINILINNPNLINFNYLLKNKNLKKIFNGLKNTDFYNEIPEEIKISITKQINLQYTNNYYDKDYNEIIWNELKEKNNIYNFEGTIFKNEYFSWIHLSDKINSIEILRDRLFFYHPYFLEKIIKFIDKDLLKYLVLRLDYLRMKQNNKIFCEELCKYVFNPLRLLRFSENLNLTLDEYIETI
jgi:hypothetical protein